MSTAAEPRVDRVVLKLSLAAFAQMLPATLIAPAVRPLIAAQHGGAEAVMHALFAVNMLGALVAAPQLGRLADRSGASRRVLLVALAMLDGLLLIALAAPVPTWLLLVMRALEGAAHVGAATLLLGEIARHARRGATGAAMGIGGGAILFAVAAGHGLGGAILRSGDPRAPFWIAGLIAIAVGAWALRASLPEGRSEEVEVAEGSTGALALSLVMPLGAAFVSRFAIGCVIVTFALFARATHQLDDSAIGGLYALLTFSFALSTIPAGRLIDRVTSAPVLILGALAYASALIAIPFVPTRALAPVMVGAGLGSGPLFAAVLHEVARQAPARSRARAMGLVHAAGCFGMLLGPACAGIVSAIASARGVGREPVFVVAASSVLLWLALSLPRIAALQMPSLSRAASDSGSPAARIAAAARSTS